MATQPGSGKTAVVFGATGLVGNDLINALLVNNSFSRIYAVARKPLRTSHPKLEQVILENFSGLMDLREKLKADVFFCCIGTTIKKAGSQESFTRVDLDIPVKIAALAQSLSIPSLVVISSLGADPDSSNFYLRTKGKMENDVRQIYKGNLKFVRPSLLMGKRSEFRFGERIAVGFMRSFGWMFAGRLRKYKGINSGDVAEAMIKISDSSPEKLVYESDELYAVLRSESI